ncbi:MAG: (2Fe-2S)-binding protein [Acidimicrobiaceae bacterium]|nr:(2Fe-2S)-binding protein [Acidimicrobiaceae bacterium]|tara:strand:+ start:2552 stop:3058 length:507 start_codon:yes stop_codon:yes gene_type:complete
MTKSVNNYLRVNGSSYEIDDSWLGESLLFTLRERLGLYGSKNACEQGECGSCSIMFDETLVCACLVLTGNAVERDIQTIESLAPDGSLSVIQQAFVDTGAIQCGFCTPGLLITIKDFLDTNPAPSDLEIREAISGNLCRCTGYGRIVEAVNLASRTHQEIEGVPDDNN